MAVKCNRVSISGSAWRSRLMTSRLPPPVHTRTEAAAVRGSATAGKGPVGGSLITNCGRPMPARWAVVITRWRRPVVSPWLATSRPRWRMLIRPPATTTATVSPISRQGTLLELVSSLDRGVGLDAAGQLAHLPEWRPPVEGSQGCRFIPLFIRGESLDRRFGSGAVDALIADLAHPPVKMRFERRPPPDYDSGFGGDAALVLSLSPRPVRRAGPPPEPPIAGEGDQPLVEGCLAGNRVMAIDQRAHCREAPPAAPRRSG